MLKPFGWLGSARGGCGTSVRWAAGALAFAAMLAGCGTVPSTGTAPTAAPRPELAAFRARLNGRQAVPPSDSQAQGQLDAVLNRQTGLLRWKLSYVGLSGPVRGASFHSPGMDGEIAPAVLSLGRALQAPYEGRAMLTPRQRADLLAGQWYVNLPTARHPQGEVRGQLIEQR